VKARLFLALFSLFLLVFNISFAQQWAFNTPYRLPITIHENLGKDRTNYAFYIGLITTDHIVKNCSNIAFTDSNGNLLPFQVVEQWYATSIPPAVACSYLVMANVSANSDTTIYAYYGKEFDYSNVDFSRDFENAVFGYRYYTPNKEWVKGSVYLGDDKFALVTDHEIYLMDGTNGKIIDTLDSLPHDWGYRFEWAQDFASPYLMYGKTFPPVCNEGNLYKLNINDKTITSLYNFGSCGGFDAMDCEGSTCVMTRGWNCPVWKYDLDTNSMREIGGLTNCVHGRGVKIVGNRVWAVMDNEWSYQQGGWIDIFENGQKIATYTNPLNYGFRTIDCFDQDTCLVGGEYTAWLIKYSNGNFQMTNIFPLNYLQSGDGGTYAMVFETVDIPVEPKVVVLTRYNNPLTQLFVYTEDNRLIKVGNADTNEWMGYYGTYKGYKDLGELVFSNYIRTQSITLGKEETSVPPTGFVTLSGSVILGLIAIGVVAYLLIRKK